MQDQTPLPIDLAAEIVGSKTKLAEILKISKQAIHNWRLSQVPAEHCPDIERLTNGKVTCEELRPDVNWSVLRTNAQSAPAKGVPANA